MKCHLVVLPIAAAVGLAACSSYDVSGESVAINTGSLSDGQAMNVIRDLHRKQVDNLNLVAGRVYHPTVGTLAVQLATMELGDLARTNMLFAYYGTGIEDTVAKDRIHVVSEDVYNDLWDRRGQDFDREFLKGEVKIYATLIELIDDRLSKDADKWGWKQELTFMRDDAQRRVNQIMDTRSALDY